MISERKRDANRANARRSTGPRSVEGQRQSARNALKHGLSLPALRNPHLSHEVRALAEQIANGNKVLMDVATEIAEAQVDLQRVRRIRTEPEYGRCRKTQPSGYGEATVNQPR
jgi:flagellar hook-basal body complex protein FliE